MIGEKIYRSNPTGKTALRYMFRPGDADGGRSYNCYPAGGLTGVDPHYSSGPGNHFFYLLAEGAVNPSGFSYTPSQLVCNGDTASTGIGRDAAQRIYYRALTCTSPPRDLSAGACAHAAGGGGPLRLGLRAVQRGGARWSAVNVN
jgi:Zn-dependent metalloprotease